MKDIKLCFLICCFLGITFAQRGMTMRIPEPEFVPMQIIQPEKHLQQSGFYLPKFALPQMLSTLDSICIDVRLAPGIYQAIFIDADAGTLGYTHPMSPVHPDLQAIIDEAPDFMKRQLFQNFTFLNLGTADEYSNILFVEADPLWRDEIFYCLGHLAAQILELPEMPRLILENVKEIYQKDSLLSYVEIVDIAPCGPEHQTIAKYITIDTGMTDFDTVEIEAEMYYRYVMFPKITDEMPRYINPNSGSPSITTGKFWRKWF